MGKCLRILRSPIIMMMILIMIGFVFVGLREDWALELYYYPFIALLLLYFVLLFYHNRKNPKQRIKVFTIVPYELREEDEGLQYITFQAMRKVYIFYAFALPTGIFLVAVFQPFIPYFSVGLLVIMGCMQYLLYWFEIRKAFKDEEEL